MRTNSSIRELRVEALCGHTHESAAKPSSLGMGSNLILMTESNVEFVLFDLGGVLIELGDLADLQEMTGFLGNRDGWQQIWNPG